jgi:hypothetical protein
MEFVMVMVICFGVGCSAIFDHTVFDSYQSCFNKAKITTEYMKKQYPQSAGEIYCMTQEELKNYKSFLNNGGQPTISTPRDIPSNSI